MPTERFGEGAVAGRAGLPRGGLSGGVDLLGGGGRSWPSLMLVHLAVRERERERDREREREKGEGERGRHIKKVHSN